MRPRVLIACALGILIACSRDDGGSESASGGEPTATSRSEQVEALLAKAYEQRAERRYGAARELFREAARLDPHHPVAARGADMKLPAAADVEKARRAYEDAVVYKRLGDFAKSYRALREARRLDPVDPGLRFEFANAAAWVRRYAEALDLFDEMIAETPRAAKLRHSASFFAFDQGDFQRAFRYVEDTALLDEAAQTDAELRGRLHQTFYMRGLAARELGRAGAAIESLRRAVALKPDEPSYRHYYGGVLLEEGRFDLAEREFRTILEAHPENVDDRVNLARALDKEGRFEEAVREYEIALAADGSRWLQMVQVARAYEAIGGDRGHLRALGWLERAIARNPQSREAYFTLARVHRRLGNTDLADRYERTHQRIRELVERNEKRLRELKLRLRDDPRDVAARLEILDIHDEYHHLEDVTKEAKELLVLFPMHPEGLYRLARVFLAQGNVDSVYFEALKLIDAAPGDDRGYHLAAWALLEKSAPQEALDLARIGFDLDPSSFAALEAMLRAMQMLGGYEAEMIKLLPTYERLKQGQIAYVQQIKNRDAQRAQELLEALR